MATFANALNLSGRAISIAYENKFLGEDFGNYARVKNITFEGIVDSRSSNAKASGVSESLTSIHEILNTANDSLSVGFVINGTNFGKGVITSIDFTEKENPIRWGYYTANLEIRDTGLFWMSDETADNLGYGFREGSSDGVGIGEHANGTVNQYTSLSYYPHLIDDFSESFSFDVGEDGAYSYSHSIDFKYVSGEAGVDFVAAAKLLANSWINEEFLKKPDFSYTMGSEYAGKYNDANVHAGKHLFDESYDLVDLSFSFSKKFSSINKLLIGDTDLSHKHSRSITRGEDGVTSVTENGQVQSHSQLSEAETYLTSITGGLSSAGHTAYDRCATLFTAFQFDTQNSPISAGAGGTGPAGTGPLGTQPRGGFEGPALALFSEPIEVTLSKDPYNFTVDYTSTFTNSKKYTPNGIIEYNHDVSYDYGVGAATIVEKGVVRPFGQKDPNFDASSLVSATVAGATARISSLIYDFRGYNTNKIIGSSENWIKTNVGVDYPKGGPSVSYSVTFKADGTYLSSAGMTSYGLSSLSTTVSDSLPQHMAKGYLIPNFKEILQFGNQTELASRAISVEAQKIRTANYLTYPPNINTQVNLMINVGIGKMLDIVREKTVLIKEMFISGLSYSFDSQTGKITLSFEVNYVAVKSSGVFAAPPSLASAHGVGTSIT